MNILAGLLQRDSGEITLGGQDYRPRSGHDGETAGIGFIQQELNIFANLSIEENLFIGHYPRLLPWLPLIDRRRMRARAIEAMRQVGLTMSDNLVFRDVPCCSISGCSHVSFLTSASARFHLLPPRSVADLRAPSWARE
jgi:ABC-type sugar transport system ATPase subunit